MVPGTKISLLQTIERIRKNSIDAMLSRWRRKYASTHDRSSSPSANQCDKTSRTSERDDTTPETNEKNKSNNNFTVTLVFILYFVDYFCQTLRSSHLFVFDCVRFVFYFSILFFGNTYDWNANVDYFDYFIFGCDWSELGLGGVLVFAGCMCVAWMRRRCQWT